MDGVGEVNGVPLFDYDVDAHDKPWKLPGTKITFILLHFISYSITLQELISQIISITVSQKKPGSYIVNDSVT